MKTLKKIALIVALLLAGSQAEAGFLRTFFSKTLASPQYSLEHLFLQTAEKFIKLRKKKIGFEPTGCFVQKLNLSMKNGEKPDIKFVTDIHGNVQPLYDLLAKLKKDGWMDKKNPFKIKKKNGYLIFLGDYVDRGENDIEVLLTIMQLYINNPDKVVILKGNHENININKEYSVDTSFKTLLSDENKSQPLEEIYKHLPSACYLLWPNDDGKKKNCILCTHGGPHIGYNHKKFLQNDSKLHEQLKKPKSGKDLYEKILKNLSSEDAKNVVANERKVFFFEENEWASEKDHNNQINYGSDLFSWTDFSLTEKSKLVNAGRGPKLSKMLLEDYLNTTSPKNIEILGIIRGHQHGGFEKQLYYGNGAHILWDKKNNFSKNKGVVTLKDLSKQFVITLDGLLLKNSLINPFITLNLAKNELSLKRIKKTNDPSLKDQFKHIWKKNNNNKTKIFAATLGLTAAVACVGYYVYHKWFANKQ